MADMADMAEKADGDDSLEGRMRCRGIRGATTVDANTREAILAVTRELLAVLVARNEIAVEEIASIFFTVSDDLDAEHPALAARQLGWTDVALLCAREIPVPGSLPRCVRVLLHVNTTRSPAELRHVYLHEAVVLRPGWADTTVSLAGDAATADNTLTDATAINTAGNTTGGRL